MPFLKELSGDQRRQIIDTRQIYESWRAAHHAKNHRFAGSMRWAERHGQSYLLRKIKTQETSLGPRSPETEAIYNAFMEGRDKNKTLLKGLSAHLDERAPINRAMGLGRIPVIAARILRRCDENGLLGQQLFVVGTNALFAYESLCGVMLKSALIASGDIDLLYDSRTRLSLAISESLKEKGLLGLLQKSDHSFSAKPRSYCAVNKDGYYVDLIRPQSRDVLHDSSRSGLTDLPDDIQAAEVFGLSWLINAPKTEAVVIDESGYPVRLCVIDPRVFALYKNWLCQRPDRDPLKAPRDREQAKAAALMATKYMNLSFEQSDLTALPQSLRLSVPPLMTTTQGKQDESPDWS